MKNNKHIIKQQYILISLFFLLIFLNRNSNADSLIDSDIKYAREKYELELIKDKPYLRKGNEPFLFSHDKKTKIAILLIHDFSASPWETKELGKYLYQKGFNVYGLRLAGHGTTPEDLLDISLDDWHKSIEEGYEITRLLGEKVVFAGLSSGGSLALSFAAEKKCNVYAVISISSALFFQDNKIVFSDIAKFFSKYIVLKLSSKFEPYYYEKRAISAISKVYIIAKKLQRNLYEITQPVLIIQSKTDQVIKPRSAEYIYDYIDSKNKKLVLLEKGPHALITIENSERTKVFEIIYDWLKKLN